ncbi:MAG: outer membrane protein transport protein [Parachlamydia sp.]|nr:outer membrane protein transport protein [Parachlamydia sp.]
MPQLLLIFLLLFAPKLEALAFTASVKSMGMAGTAIAYPLDSLAGAYNLAGMVFIGDRIDVGTTWVYERGKIKVRESPVRKVDGEFDCMNNQTILLAEFGINRVWSDECYSWSFGLMAYPASFQKTHLDHSFPFFKRRKLNVDRVTYSISPVLAMACGESHAVGVSLNWLIERQSRSEHHDDECGRHYSHGVSTSIGWRWEVANWMALGVAYRSKVYMCKCKKERSIDLPEKWGGGLLLQPFESLAICGDVEWINWEDCHLRDSLVHEKHHKKHHKHKHFGNESFKNQTLYSIGVEYQLTERWFVRAGWRHSNSPVQDNETFLNALAIDTIQDYVTAGTTWLCDCGEISAFVAYGLENDLSSRHAIPHCFKSGQLTLTESKTLVGLACAWYY